MNLMFTLLSTVPPFFLARMLTIIGTTLLLFFAFKGIQKKKE